jgi:hypothetical protein
VVPVTDVLHKDVSETYKGSVHLALFGLASVCAAYNLGACVVRPEWRLGVNAAGYALLMAIEAAQIKAHWSEP